MWQDKYDHVSSFTEGFASVRKNKKYGFIDTSGNEICELKYDVVSPFCDGLAAVGLGGLGGKCGFINTSGIEICPIKYEYITGFKNGSAVVELDVKCGLINRSGQEICKIKYDYVDNFDEGFATAGIGNKKYYLSENGIEHKLINGKYWFKRDNKLGYLTKEEPHKEVYPVPLPIALSLGYREV